MSNMDAIVREAINNKKLLEFDYDGFHRIVEPHVYGSKGGKNAILAYQVRGSSSSGNIPDWRRMALNKISNMRILNEEFDGRRETHGSHSSFDITHLIVS